LPAFDKLRMQMVEEFQDNYQNRSIVQGQLNKWLHMAAHGLANQNKHDFQQYMGEVDFPPDQIGGPF